MSAESNVVSLRPNTQIISVHTCHVCEGDLYHIGIDRTIICVGCKKRVKNFIVESNSDTEDTNEV